MNTQVMNRIPYHAVLCLLGSSLLAQDGTNRSTAFNFNFKSGSEMKGEIIAFKGTNSVIIRDKDAKPYSIKISMLTEESQRRLDTNACRAQEIAGAFGLALGQKFNPAAATSVEKRAGSLNYDFRPSVPLPNFAHYSVEVTPRTGRIYRIAALAVFDGNSAKYAWEATGKLMAYDDAAQREYEKILAALWEKYGRPACELEPDEQRSEIRKNARVTRGDREAWVSYTQSSGSAFVHLVYRDKSLEAQALKEASDNGEL
jgi:hypothetical protein